MPEHIDDESPRGFTSADCETISYNNCKAIGDVPFGDVPFGYLPCGAHFWDGETCPETAGLVHECAQPERHDGPCECRCGARDV